MLLLLMRAPSSTTCTKGKRVTSPLDFAARFAACGAACTPPATATMLHNSATQTRSTLPVPELQHNALRECFGHCQSFAYTPPHTPAAAPRQQIGAEELASAATTTPAVAAAAMLAAALAATPATAAHPAPAVEHVWPLFCAHSRGLRCETRGAALCHCLQVSPTVHTYAPLLPVLPSVTSAKQAEQVTATMNSKARQAHHLVCMSLL